MQCHGKRARGFAFDVRGFAGVGSADVRLSQEAQSCPRAVAHGGAGVYLVRVRWTIRSHHSWKMHGRWMEPGTHRGKVRGMPLSLEAKSTESLALVDICLKRQRFLTAAAGRAYYAVFQRMKHLLETEGFDYQGFLASANLVGERPYSHGTIVRALRDHVRKTRRAVALSDLQKFGPLDQLYAVRRKSDYDAGYEVDARNLTWCYTKASEMLQILANL